MKRVKQLFLLCLAITSLIYTGCLQESESPSPTQTVTIDKRTPEWKGYTDVDAEQLKIMLENKNFTLINVHIPHDKDIPSTDLSIPFNEIGDNLNQLPKDKDFPLVLYCQSGNMSTQAAERLVELGYTNIFELDGGMIAWADSGGILR